MGDKNSFHRRSTASASAALRLLPSRPEIHARAIAASPLEELVNDDDSRNVGSEPDDRDVNVDVPAPNAHDDVEARDVETATDGDQ
jgi:hypothetical protein